MTSEVQVCESMLCQHLSQDLAKYGVMPFMGDWCTHHQMWDCCWEEVKKAIKMVAFVSKQCQMNAPMALIQEAWCAVTLGHVHTTYMWCGHDANLRVHFKPVMVGKTERLFVHLTCGNPEGNLGHDGWCRFCDQPKTFLIKLPTEPIPQPLLEAVYQHTVCLFNSHEQIHKSAVLVDVLGRPRPCLVTNASHSSREG